MSKRKIYAFTGLPASGKSFVANTFAGLEGIPVISIGDVMHEQKEKMPTCYVGKPKAPEGTWEYAQKLRETHGGAGPAVAITGEVGRAFVESNTVVVEGVRSVEEKRFLEQAVCPNVHLVAVHTDYETRLDRFYERDEYDERGVAEYEMQVRTERECDAGLDDAIDHAMFKIENGSGVTEDDITDACLRLQEKEL